MILPFECVGLSPSTPPTPGPELPKAEVELPLRLPEAVKEAALEAAACLFFANAYTRLRRGDNEKKRKGQHHDATRNMSHHTHPAKKPVPIALVLPGVTASPKNTIPLKAKGSLLRAPTIE